MVSRDVKMALVLVLMHGCCAFRAPLPPACTSRPSIAPNVGVRMTGAQLTLFPLLYGAAAGSLATRAVTVAVSNPLHGAVLGSIALALLTDFGPSAARDIRASNAASRANVDALIDASPAAILVDNVVKNLGPEEDESLLIRQMASQRVDASNHWALFVRARVLGDCIGVLLLLNHWSDVSRVFRGAALLLLAHALSWACGGAAARMDSQGRPNSLSPPLAKIIGTVTFTLAAAAALGGLPLGDRTPPLVNTVRTVAGWAFSGVLIGIECARLVADRVRARTHVGI